ncbi:LamG-like jellyroll fold domain-containing protein [Nonomuraea sediminis]|uniref:LamG-like jellyroll fold domain-containing protein n=1 Tax=Nonomuraea sediminis TaxID=2835864 RepID=UPI001BDC1890|nr:LamG-like jellyroll fold domain-containing protein [Nonomuraea sediminis]
MRRSPRGVVFTVALSLLAGSFAVGVHGPASATTATEDPPARTEREALDQARTTKRQVEVLPLRAENRQVFANPDGSFTSETSALPERVRRGAGWADVDPTLVFAPGGSVHTVATPLDLGFSGGGTAPLASIGENGRSVSMTWPGTLPKPVLEGSTATYGSVLPGVDLKVTASVLGFSEVLVVKTREAAANPALAKLGFGMRASGLAVRKTATGGLSAVTDSGTEVFHSPPPRMWDSSGATPRPSLTAEPEQGNRQAVMGVDVAQDRIAITPDRNVLTGPGTTYPVYIDPQWSGSKLAWTYVDKAFPSQEYWNSSHTPEIGYYGSGVKRSFFRMDSDNVNGKHILKATFRITQNKSWGCTSDPQVAQLWLTGGISKYTNWSHQPSWAEHLGSVASDAGYSSSCPDKGIEFDVTGTIVKAARNGWPNTTFGLRDYDDEARSVWGWKGFSSSPKLVIDYNTPPAAPSGVGTDPGTPCVTGPNRPYINAGDAANPIKLKAKIYDPDKANDGVRAEFEMNHYNATTAQWESITSSLPGGGKTAYTYATTPTDHSITLSGLVTGQTYSYKVRAYDGTDASAWSGWCEFTVDTVDPATLPKVTSADYPANTPDDWQGGVGSAGTFTLASGDGETDVTSFRYALDDPSLATTATQVTIAPGQSSVAVQVAPRHDWLNTLYVYPVDKAGNVGKTPTAYSFYVKAGADPVGQWHLDETSGSTAADSAATQHPVTLDAGTEWTGGRVNGALHLDGTTGYGATSGPVVHTDRGMSVSAWVRLASNARNATVVSQSGNLGSGFSLYYSSSYKRWIFNKYDADSANPTVFRAIGDTEPQLNVWTHLVGVYDAPARQLRLYVNGTRQSTPGTVTGAPWDATGPLQIGRVRYGGDFLENFPGDIDEVRAWNRILSDDPRTVNDPSLGNEIAAMAKQPPAELGHWTFDEGTGGTAADASGHGRTATLAGNAGWSGDGVNGTGVLSLDGTTAYAATASPPVRTDHSYTVAAWVRLNGDDTCVLPDHNLTAVSQDGTRNSGFYLGYRWFTENGAKVYRWSFSTTSNDTDSEVMTQTKSASAVDCSALNAWTHLAGVYDEVAKVVRLYVNGQLVDVRPWTGWHAGGGLQIGRARYKGAYVDYFAGDVDDVRTYAGALTDGQIVNLAMGLPLDG